MLKKFLILILVFSPICISAATRVFYFRDSVLARESLFNYPRYIDILAFAKKKIIFTDGRLILNR